MLYDHDLDAGSNPPPSKPPHGPHYRRLLILLLPAVGTLATLAGRRVPAAAPPPFGPNPGRVVWRGPAPPTRLSRPPAVVAPGIDDRFVRPAPGGIDDRFVVRAAPGIDEGILVTPARLAHRPAATAPAPEPAPEWLNPSQPLDGPGTEPFLPPVAPRRPR